MDQWRSVDAVQQRRLTSATGEDLPIAAVRATDDPAAAADIAETRAPTRLDPESRLSCLVDEAIPAVQILSGITGWDCPTRYPDP